MPRKKRLSPLPVEEWDDSLRPVVDAMSGKPLNIHKLMANHPALLKAWWEFRQYIVGGGLLGIGLRITACQKVSVG